MSMVQLQDLRAKILSIPGKRMRSDLVGRLRLYGEKMQKARITLEKTINGQKQSSCVFPHFDFSDSVTPALKATSTAKTLAARLTKEPTVIKSKGTDKSIVNISNFAETSLNELRNQWKKAVTGKTQTFQSIAKAATDAKLKGCNELNILLYSIVNKATSPPFTCDQAETIRKQFEDLLTVISELGLEGDVLDFILNAAKGSADPKALYNPLVKEFVERHSLWQSLRVRLS